MVRETAKGYILGLCCLLHLCYVYT
ncbi:MAG: hypothetical protein FD151_891, partial [bacterium]